MLMTVKDYFDTHPFLASENVFSGCNVASQTKEDKTFK